MTATAYQQRLALVEELARELARIDLGHWTAISYADQDRYRELAGYALEFVETSRPPGPRIVAERRVDDDALAEVERALRKIVGAKPLGKWLLERLRVELGQATP